MLKVLRIVGAVFLLAGLVATAAAAGYLVMQWVRERIWEVEIFYLGLCAVGVSATGLIALALLEIRDTIEKAASKEASKSESPRPGVDVRTSYLDIRER
jgi:hypothetical protein